MYAALKYDQDHMGGRYIEVMRAPPESLIEALPLPAAKPARRAFPEPEPELLLDVCSIISLLVCTTCVSVRVPQPLKTL